MDNIHNSRMTAGMALELNRKKLRAQRNRKKVLQQLMKLEMIGGHPDGDYIDSLKKMERLYKKEIQDIDTILNHGYNGKDQGHRAP